MPSINYQLKYCERCGSLNLRRAGSAETYCHPCEQALRVPASEALLSRLLRRKPRRAKEDAPILPAQEQLPLCWGRLP